MKDTQQLPMHNDQVRCGKCKRLNSVAVYPDLKENKYICKYCTEVQDWEPSDLYKKIVGRNATH